MSVGLVTWLLVDQTIPLNFAQEQDDNTIVTIIYLVMTLVLVLLSILGMYGAGKEVKWALVVVSSSRDLLQQFLLKLSNVLKRYISMWVGKYIHFKIIFDQHPKLFAVCPPILNNLMNVLINTLNYWLQARQ